MKRIIFLIGLLVMVVFLSCGSYSKLKTTQGKPEVLINNVSDKDVYKEILRGMCRKGYSIDRLEQYYFLSFTRNVDNSFGYIFGGGLPTEKEKVTFGLSDTDDGVIVYASLHRTYRGRYLEQHKYKPDSRLRVYLRELKAKIEK